MDMNAYLVYADSGASPVAIYGSNIPARIQYYFSNEIECDEFMLPFLKVDVSLKHNPFINMYHDAIVHSNYLNGNNYYELYGDSFLMYKGYNPPLFSTSYVTQEQVDNGEVSNNIARVYEIQSPNYFRFHYVTSPSDSYQFRSGQIMSVSTQYNMIVDGTMATYEQFSTIAIDSLSNNLISGQGTYSLVHLELVGENWVIVSSDVTKNIQKNNIPLFDSSPSLALVTAITFYGTLYKNGAIYLPQGMHDIYFSTESAMVDTWNLIFDNKYRVFYSNKRATTLSISLSTYQFVNLPIASSYQDDALPYSILTFKLHPIAPSQAINKDYFVSGKRTEKWIKIADGVYRFVITGFIPLTVPATKSVSYPYQWISETYSKVSTSYVRNAENREIRYTSVYTSEDVPVEGRCRIVLKSPQEMNTIEQVKIND